MTLPHFCIYSDLIQNRHTTMELTSSMYLTVNIDCIQHIHFIGDLWILTFVKSVLFLALVCDCDAEGTARDICNPNTGACICMENYAGPRCDVCNEGYYNFPRCSGNFNTCIVIYCKLTWKN